MSLNIRSVNLYASCSYEKMLSISLFFYFTQNGIWRFDINYYFQMLLVLSLLLMVNLLEVFLRAFLFSVSLLVVCACPYYIK